MLALLPFVKLSISKDATLINSTVNFESIFQVLDILLFLCLTHCIIQLSVEYLLDFSWFISGYRIPINSSYTIFTPIR